MQLVVKTMSVVGIVDGGGSLVRAGSMRPFHKNVTESACDRDDDDIERFPLGQADESDRGLGKDRHVKRLQTLEKQTSAHP